MMGTTRIWTKAKIAPLLPKVFHSFKRLQLLEIYTRTLDLIALISSLNSHLLRPDLGSCNAGDHFRIGVGFTEPRVGLE